MWEWFSNNWIWIVFVACPGAVGCVGLLIGYAWSLNEKDEEVVLNHTRKVEGPPVTYIDMEAPDWKAQLEGALLKTEEAAQHGDR